MTEAGTTSNERRLELQGVGLSLGGRVLVAPLDLVVGAGEIATVMGPSGCGKSSLLAFVCGTLDPAFAPQGRVRWRSGRPRSHGPQGPAPAEQPGRHREGQGEGGERQQRLQERENSHDSAVGSSG